MEFHHISVLLNECIDNLNITPDGIYVDGTMGGGGHSLEIAKRLTTGRLICIDQDPNAHEAAGKRLAEYKDRITFVRDNFGNIANILDSLGIEKIDGMLLDIGVSSHQLDEAERGFSYQQDAPLDMRMNPDRPFSAYDVVNGYDEDELDRVIFTYGEERWARRIAQFIVKERENKPIETTGELVDIIKKAVPKGARKDGPHPAKRTFQAIRIEVNGELEVLQRAIDDVAARLAVGGRLCIITFHSLEDRIVKDAFRKQENPCICPPQFPVCVCGKKPLGRVITRKPILPSKEELEENPRSRSAKLLIAADCTAYAYAAFHEKFIKGHITLVGCPKLDSVDYSEKLTEIIRENDIKSVIIVRMEVPCCGGLEFAAKTALQQSGKFIPWQVVTISTDGRILD